MSIADSVIGIALAVGLLALGFLLEKAFGSKGAIAGFVIIVIVMAALYDWSSDCRIEWDGRSNPSVCE